MRKTFCNISTPFAALVLVSAIGPTHGFAAPISLSGGGVLSAANVSGGLVALTSAPPCISFSGSATCAAIPAVSPIAISNADPIFAATGTIKDVAATPLVSFKTANLTVPGGPAIFDLLSITAPSGFPTCTLATVGGSCSTGFLILSQVSATQVAVTFNTTEVGYTGSKADGFTPYQGVFTTQLSGGLAQFGCVSGGTQNCADTINNILQFQAAGGTIRSTWSATESPTVQPRGFTGCTVTQGGWGAAAHGNNPGTFLNTNFFPTYGIGGVAIGGNFTLRFLTAADVRAFLPQGGPPSFLNSSAVNPTTRTSAGVFAGQVLALELNVDLEGLGSLVLTGTGTPLDHLSVAQILGLANIALGGGPLPPGFASYSALNDVIDELNSSFDGCAMDSWAVSHLH
jgi:hypothetical protein